MVECPKGCPGQYGGIQWMAVKYDEQKLPTHRECPKCGHKILMTFKEKMADIIYGGDWYFGTQEGCEVDEYYLEDENAIMEKLLMVIPSVKFVKHITTHLQEGEPVICKICGKTYEEIQEEN